MDMTIQEVQARLSQISKRLADLGAEQRTPERLSEIKALFSEAYELTDRLQELHVYSFGDPAKIYKDGCMLLEDAIQVIYMHFYRSVIDGTISATKNEPVLISVVNNLRIHRFSVDFHRSLAEFSDLNLSGDNLPIFLEEKSMLDLVKTEILKYHLHALEGLPERKRLTTFVDQTLKDSPYIRRKTSSTQSRIGVEALTVNDMLPMYHFSGFDRMAALNRSDFEADGVTNQLSYENTDNDDYFSMVIKGIEKFMPSIPLNCHKLFALALALFSWQNPKLKDNKPSTYTVMIPIGWYISMLDVNTSENEARRRIRNDLKTLYNASVRIKSQKYGHGEFRLIQAYTTKPSFITITFGTKIIDFFAQLPKTKYALWTLPIGGKENANTYRLGNKLVTHASMKNNQFKGTSNKLSVSSLLAVTDLPTISTLQKRGRDGKTSERKWRQRVKQPFEKAMDDLVTRENGGLLSWHYAQPGSAGKKISRDDVDQIASYQEYSKIMIVYELALLPVYADRNNDENCS